MIEKIEYRKNGKTVETKIHELPKTLDEGSLIAQKHMSKNKSIETAHIFSEKIERVVSRPTKWQKRN